MNDHIAPLGYLTGFGPKADQVVPLTWGVLTISLVVVFLLTLLVLIGTLVRRAKADGGVRSVAVERTAGSSGLNWIYWGVGVSSIALIGTIVWTVVVLAAVRVPDGPPGLTIQVTGQQWWWKARYESDRPSEVFDVADEIHIPVGVPVRVKLIGADVIHSFWVPALTGKTQTIPGLQNETWMQADRPGRYMGQCTEYCGQQHAHMQLVVVADPPEAFDAWRHAQISPASAPPTQALAKGEKTFVFYCGACHSVRGTEAGGTIAPDLTHLMSRAILAGNVVPNGVGYLAGWIANPDHIKPGTRMPTLFLSGPDLQAVTSYLVTLK